MCIKKQECVICILKGQCHEIFCFWLFYESVSPQPQSIPLRPFRIFFQNSRRYSQLKVDHLCRWHRWQMKKIFNQKNFNNFVGTPLNSRVNIYINLCLQVHFKVSSAWLISLFATGVVDTGGKFAAWIVDTGGKFATGLNNTTETGGKICRRCRWYCGKFATGVIDTDGQPLAANISANFRKNSKRPQWYTQGLGGNWFMKPEAKNLVTLSL